VKLTKDVPFSLFIFDLDGTVLGGHEPYEQFPPEFVKLLDELDSCGVKWATATTWPVDKQIKLIRSSGVKSDPALLTGSTGRTAFTVNDGEIFPTKDYMKEIAELDSKLDEKYGKFINNMVGKLKTQNYAEEISYNRFGHHVISFKTADGKTEELWRVLQSLIDEGIYYSFNPGNLKNNSLLPEYMNKGRAIKLIQKLANVSPSETLIAGDETNDLHMFDSTLAKYMVCPNNAHREIKKIVSLNNGIIATKNYSYGIVEAVNKLLKHK
jgi:HAD superfamily hydrolase (TIGR01484 family)